MYLFNFHHVEPRPNHESRRNITITPEGLRRFIRTVRQFGFEIVSLQQILSKKPQPGWAALTFDDGYQNFYDFAFPVLQEEDCPATVFVLGGKLGGTNDWDQGHLPVSQRDRLMTITQLQTMYDRFPKITFGNHGMNHQNLAWLSDAELSVEINDSYAILREHLGEGFVPVMAYPWGAYSPKVLEAMKTSKHQFAFTTQKGRWERKTSVMEIPRHSVYFRDSSPFILLAKFYHNGILVPST